MSALDLALVVLGLPVLGMAAYLAILALFATKPTNEEGALLRRLFRFDVVVAAHDEEAGIARTVKSLLGVDYPAALRRVLVVADNCSDATAARAAEAGAVVLVRDEPERRGKGYALEHAFARIEEDGVADVVAVVDADTTVSPGLLRAFARRLAAGAEAVQAEYGVENADASWRTRLLVIALALFHLERSLARERLGLSVGLRGNGMAFTRELLRRVPYRAYSLVEDVEYSLSLGEAGVRVAFAPEARVFGEMVSTGEAARSQRARWERGRAALAFSRAPRLLATALRRREPVLAELALDLLVPPLSSLVLAATLGTGLALARVLVATPSALAHVAFAEWTLSAAYLVLYVLRGWALSGTGARGLGALLWAPVYVVWKLGLALRRPARRGPEWVRTAREGGPS